MIGCNDHGQPPLGPERKSEPTLDLPDFYLDLMFGDLPASNCPTKVADDQLGAGLREVA